MTDNEQQLLVEEIDSILVITLNRPNKLNALTGTMIQGIHDAVDEYARQDDLRCFLIRAGGDISVREQTCTMAREIPSATREVLRPSGSGTVSAECRASM